MTYTTTTYTKLNVEAVTYNGVIYKLGDRVRLSDKAIEDTLFTLNKDGEVNNTFINALRDNWLVKYYIIAEFFQDSVGDIYVSFQHSIINPDDIIDNLSNYQLVTEAELILYEV